MTDVTTKQALRVSTESTAGPYLMLPLSQVEEVRRLLDSHRIRYWVDEHAISFEGGRIQPSSISDMPAMLLRSKPS